MLLKRRIILGPWRRTADTCGRVGKNNIPAGLLTRSLILDTHLFSPNIHLSSGYIANKPFTNH